MQGLRFATARDVLKMIIAETPTETVSGRNGNRMWRIAQKAAYYKSETFCRRVLTMIYHGAKRYDGPRSMSATHHLNLIEACALGQLIITDEQVEKYDLRKDIMGKALRTFMFNGQRLPDLDGSKTPDQIREMHAADYPELTTCKVSFSKKDGRDIYEFKKAVGTKG